MLIFVKVIDIHKTKRIDHQGNVMKPQVGCTTNRLVRDNKGIKTLKNTMTNQKQTNLSISKLPQIRTHPQAFLGSQECKHSYDITFIQCQINVSLPTHYTLWLRRPLPLM